MKINLENIHSPCEQCFIDGHRYFPDDDKCQRCEYNITIVLLKEVLKTHNYCSLCKNLYSESGFGCCKLNGKGCHNCDSYEIDWEAIVRKYQIDRIIITD